MKLPEKIGSRLLLFDWAAWFGVGLVFLYVPVVQREQIAWYFSLVAVAVAVTFMWGVALLLMQSVTSFLYGAAFLHEEKHQYERESVALFVLGMHAVLPVVGMFVFLLVAN